MRVGRVDIALAASLVVAAVSACGGTPVDLVKTLQVSDISTGWYDAGIVEGNKNKLVPTISIRLKNGGDANIAGTIQLNAVFRRQGEGEEWGSTLRRAVGSEGLGGGAMTPPIVLRSDLGYTGTESRADLLKNRLFVDARVQLFAKHGSAQWARLGEYRIERRLLTD
jgi:hypothetical protein